MKFRFILLYLFYILLPTIFTAESLLKGKMISCDENSNIVKYAFDNRLTTQFKSVNESNCWVGMYLRSNYIITKIEWGTNETDHNTYLLGVFEGANQKNFEDAIPIYMITTKGKINSMNTVNIGAQTQFQYIRYVGPNGQYCKINNIRIFGFENEGSTQLIEYYKPSNLPLMVIHTSTGEEPTSKEMSASFSTTNENEVTKYSGTINLMGNEKLNYYKRNYLIHFDKEQNILDFENAAKRYVLMGNYGDKTLIRNLLSYKISEMLDMEYTVKCYPIDLMVNGEYKGTYNLCEYIEISENKINIYKMTNKDANELKITGGYLLEIDGFAYLGDLCINSKKGVPVSIRAPDEEDGITQNQIDYIKDKFDILENDIYNNNFTNIDMESFIKYFLIGELIGNAESFWSTYLYKDKNDEKFYFGPIWDNGMGFDNDNRVYPVNCKKRYIFNYGLSAGTLYKCIKNIIDNKNITERIKYMWEEKIVKKLDLDYINDFINETVSYLNESKNLNFLRWKILDKQVYFNPKVYDSYEEEIDVVKEFIKNRISWLNHQISNISDKSSFSCNVPIPSLNNDVELDYDIDDDQNNDNGLNYQLLSNSFYFKNISFLFFVFLNFIFI